MRRAHDVNVTITSHSNDKYDPALHHDFQYSASSFRTDHNMDKLSGDTVGNLIPSEELGEIEDSDRKSWKEEDALDSSASSSSSSRGSFSTKRIPSVTTFTFFYNKGKDKL